MTLFFSIITGVLTVVAIISLFWSIIGVPAGIILFIANHFNKKIKNKKELIWMCFGGIIVLISVFVLFFIVSFIEGFLGVSPSSFQLPQLK